MNPTTGHFKRYVMALVLVVAAFLFRIAIEKLMGPGLPAFITFYPAIMFSALVLGLGPGLLATAASAVLSDYFIFTPYSLGYWNRGDATALILFTGMGIIMSLIAHRYRQIRGRMEELVAERTDKLNHAKNEWESTFDSMPDLIAILDNKHRIMRVNRAMAERLKLEPSQCIGLPCYSVMHGTDIPPGFCPHSKSLSDREEHTAEVQGTVFGDSFLVTTTPLFDNQGSIYATVHVARDITELKQSEKALRENEVQLQLFIKHAPAALAMFDRDMRYLQASRRWISDYGLGDRDLLGLSHYEVFPEISEQWKEIHRRTLAGEVLQKDADRFERTDGSVQWVRWETRPWHDTSGNAGGIVIFSEEITERKQTEEVLRFLGQCGLSKSGEGFFQELARYLAQALKMDFVCIDQLEEDHLSARTLAVFHNGEFEDNVSYTLKDTPCGDVVGKRICCFPRNVCGLFPKDEVLRELQAESYLGTTLWSAQGEPIGLIAVIGRQPLVNSRLAESILQVAAVRAAGELERQQAETAVRHAHNELEQRVAERTQQLAETVETLLEQMTSREIVENNLKRLNNLYTVLSETNQAIVHARDCDSLFQDFCRIAVEHGGFLLSWVGLVEEETGMVRIIATYGATSYLEDLSITTREEPAGLGPTGIALREGTYYICNDFQNAPCTQPWHDRGKAYGIRSSASVSLKVGGRVTGALTLYAQEKDFFDQQHEALLVQIGEDVSFALDNLERDTQRRKMEQALLSETSERLRAVEALRKQEILLIQQSRQAAMGEMIGNIAHQWRQPLNTLGLFTQRLGFFYGSPSFNKEFLETSIAKSMEIIQYMSRTIDDFRNFFSTEREKSDFNANEAVNKALSLVEASFKERRINIEIDEQQEVIINGLPNEYAQVLLNIFINARDAMHERNIEFPKLRISVAVENGSSVVTIGDNAGGIPEEIIDKIFDPYFTTKSPQQGTGVGLFMSKTIIENNMGGRLTACNTGEGAEFRIEV